LNFDSRTVALIPTPPGAGADLEHLLDLVLDLADGQVLAARPLVE